MDPERGIPELLHTAVATLEPRTSALVAGGTCRGRTLRRRRRLAQASSGMALVGLIAGVAVAVWPSSQPSSQPASRAAQRSAPPVSRPAPSPRPHPATPATATITPQVLLQRTLALLPPHSSTSDYTGRSFAGWVGAELVYDDGAGAAAIDVAMGFVQDGISGAQPPCADPAPGCRVLPDGAHLRVFRGSEFSQGRQPDNATQWSVDLVRADGVEVSLTEWNSPQEKDAPITRTDPPLRIAQLTAIARDPRLSPQVPARVVAAADPLFRPHPVVSERKLEREAEAVNVARAERAAARNARAEARAKEKALQGPRHHVRTGPSGG
jgi:hypothetical protein